MLLWADSIPWIIWKHNAIAPSQYNNKIWMLSKLFFKKVNSRLASGRGNLNWDKCKIKKAVKIIPVNGWIFDVSTPKESLLLVFKKAVFPFEWFWIDFWMVKKIWIMKVKARPISKKGKKIFECKLDTYISNPFGYIPA